jgi:hypothetical protein
MKKVVTLSYNDSNDIGGGLVVNWEEGEKKEIEKNLKDNDENKVES